MGSGWGGSVVPMLVSSLGGLCGGDAGERPCVWRYTLENLRLTGRHVRKRWNKCAKILTTGKFGDVGVLCTVLKTFL